MQNVSENRPIRVDVWRWCLLLIASSGLTTGLSAAEPARIQPNGGWCWFQRERAVMLGERVIFTTIAGEDRDGFSGGDLVVTSYDFSNGRRLHFILHPQLGKDDHNVASLTVLPEQRLLAVYGRHGQDHLQRWRITEEAGSVDRWSPEATLDVGAGYTYSNVFSVDDEGTYYNFHRGVGFNPNCTISKIMEEPGRMVGAWFIAHAPTIPMTLASQDSMVEGPMFVTHQTTVVRYTLR